MAILRARDLETQIPVCTCGCCGPTYRDREASIPEFGVGRHAERRAVPHEAWQQEATWTCGCEGNGCACGCGCCG